MKKLLRMASMLLATVMLITVFSGCNSKNPDNSLKENTSEETGKGSSSTGAESQQPEPLTLPITNKPITLTMFKALGFKAATVLKDYNEMESYKEVEKRTGIHIEFIHPPVGQEGEQLNIMIASNNLPDMIQWGWDGIPGGPSKLLDDKTIIDLTDLMKKYAPNYMKLMNEQPEWRKMTVTDDKKHFMFGYFWGDDFNRTNLGFMVRKDWLDKLDLKEPATIDEWYTMLKAFKEKDPNGNGKQDEIPFGHTNQAWSAISKFTYGWGLGPTTIDSGFFNDKGQIKFTPLDPKYKEYLSTMRKWYSEGLFDPEFAMTDRKTFDAKMTGDLIGSTFGGAGTGFMGLYLQTMKSKNHPTFTLEGVPFLKTSDGKVIGHKEKQNDGNGVALTPSSKNLKEAVKWLDYGYSEEGRYLKEFGPEGKAYKLVNGKVEFTDEVLKNPKGLTFDSALIMYGEAPWNTALVQHDAFWRTSTSFYKQQSSALAAWEPADTSMLLPSIRFTVEEGQKVASIVNETRTYVDEMTTKFIMGQEPIENFDKFGQTLKKMNVDEAIKIYQDALDRYNKR